MNTIYHHPIAKVDLKEPDLKAAERRLQTRSLILRLSGPSDESRNSKSCSYRVKRDLARASDGMEKGWSRDRDGPLRDPENPGAGHQPASQDRHLMFFQEPGGRKSCVRSGAVSPEGLTANPLSSYLTQQQGVRDCVLSCQSLSPECCPPSGVSLRRVCGMNGGIDTCFWRVL